MGSKATGAKKGLDKLKSQWDEISFGDRAVLTQNLQAAASNIGKFTRAGDNPLEAVKGAINMIAQFAALAGPTGQMISVALSFVSGFLSLFGAGGEKKKSVGEIVREEIDAALAQYYANALSNEARGRENRLHQLFIPEPTARSAVPGVSPGRELLIPHGYLHPGKSEQSEV